MRGGVFSLLTQDKGRLERACEEGDLDAVKKICDRTDIKNVRFDNRCRGTPLHLAAR